MQLLNKGGKNIAVEDYHKAYYVRNGWSEGPASKTVQEPPKVVEEDSKAESDKEEAPKTPVAPQKGSGK
jgi:hypothetical protein